MQFSTTVLAALLASLTAAHPGHSTAPEIAARREYMAHAKVRDLSHCSAKLKARGVEARNQARREQAAEAARAKRGLKSKRTFESVLATDHNETSAGYTVDTAASDLFSSNASCILTPEVTQGPYYVGGEYIREDIAEDQAGIATTLDYQVIDVNTCDPVPNVYLEMWHCNATGVYSGIVSGGNGDSSDLANINATWLRGIQETDADGVATFETIFPGHYTSRANHVHILIHTNVTVYENGTLGNDVSSSHIGQAFFDQDLISAAELVAPYSTNTQELTLNEDDSIFEEETATDGVDPVYAYTYLGDDVADGIFGWLAFGIDTSASQTITPAAYYYAEGGVANANSGSGMGGGSGGPPSKN